MIEIFKNGTNTSNQQKIKESNLKIVFNIIADNKSISRAEIAGITGLSPTTVSSLAEELMSNGLIFETGAGSSATSGRKPIMLEINPDGGFFACIDFKTKSFFIEIFNLKCIGIDGIDIESEDYSHASHLIIEKIDFLLEKNNIRKEKLFGICLGIPALIDYNKRRVISSTILPFDEECDFYNILNDKYEDTYIEIVNESSLFAYAELKYGVGGEINNLLYIDIHTGIGSGIVLNGEIFKGYSGQAGEFGHISVDFNGPICKCGSRGCIETFASIPAILQKVAYGIMSGRDTVMRDICNQDLNKINIELVREALDKKDKFVIGILDETALKLAFAINSTMNIINPEITVIGGEITKLGNEFLNMIKNHVEKIELLKGREKDIIFSKLVINPVTSGGARYIMDGIFK